MQKKWLILNMAILVILVLMLVWIVWNFSFNGVVSKNEECVDVNNVASLVYDVCYDAYSKNIFLEVKRSVDSYDVNSLDVSFFDFVERDYKLKDVPSVGGSKAYKISAEKNPKNIKVILDIVKDFSSPICEDPRNLLVRYCPAGGQGGEVNASLSPLRGVDIDSFIEIGKVVNRGSDVFNLKLVDKERIWKSKCESSWECDGWEACEDGFQNRKCRDLKKCFIPTGVPDTVKNCNDTCSENWECEWSECRGGVTIPKCKDLNNCGTSYDIPRELKCGDSKKCVPNINCSDWSNCEIDYNFFDLIHNDISNLSGSKFRTCVDKNSCVEPHREVLDCAINVDVYTRKFTKCGQKFVGVYNRMDNDLIARISEGTKDNPYLNINLDDKDSSYCDYCFDGRLSGDEEGIDCGGSCESCADKYRRVYYKKKTLWDSFIRWVKKMLI